MLVDLDGMFSFLDAPSSTVARGTRAVRMGVEKPTLWGALEMAADGFFGVGGAGVCHEVDKERPSSA